MHSRGNNHDGGPSRNGTCASHDRSVIEAVERRWSKQVKPEPQPLRPLFEQAAAEGFEMLEWRSPTSHGVTVPETDLMADGGSAEEIRALSEEFHLALAYHAPQGGLWEFGALALGTAVSRLRQCIRRAQSINAGIMVFHLGIGDGRPRLDGIRQAAEVIRTAAPYAEALGVRLCVENVYEEHSIATVEECTALFDAADDPRLRLALDSGHAHLCGCLHEMAAAFGDRLAFTHIHDNDGTKDQHRVPGRGTIDWRKLICGLDSVGYMGPINFELRERCALPELKRIWNDFCP